MIRILCSVTIFDSNFTFRSNMLGKIVAISLLCIGAVSSDCRVCTSGGSKWCVEKETCGASVLGCKTHISDPLNCPVPMHPGYEYNDTFTRNVVLPLITGAYALPDARQCLKNALPTTTFDTNVIVQCYAHGPHDTCHAYTAYDHVKQQIYVVFEGTEGNLQLSEEILAFFHKKRNFYNHGHVFEYFYDAFNFLWSGGLEYAVRSLKFRYPQYELVAVGHSMGAAICSVFASYVLETKMYKPENVKLITFGQPRTGDRNFSMWHDSTFLYSYRVNHHRDPAPHVPPMGGADEVFHHRHEIWYNNDMSIGQSYQVCLEADGPHCSNKQIDDVGKDHIVYFNVNMDDWSDQNCKPFN